MQLTDKVLLLVELLGHHQAMAKAHTGNQLPHKSQVAVVAVDHQPAMVNQAQLFQEAHMDNQAAVV